MSVYAIHKLLWLSEEDPEFRARIQSGPEEAMKGFALTTEEVQALKGGDIHALHHWGVSPEETDGSAVFRAAAGDEP